MPRMRALAHRDIEVQRAGQLRDVVDIDRLAGDVPRGAVMRDRLRDAAADRIVVRADASCGTEVIVPGDAAVLDQRLVHQASSSTRVAGSRPPPFSRWKRRSRFCAAFSR